MPMATRRCAGIVVTSRPSKTILPALGGKKPLIKLKKVVFPAPFGPMIARNSPRATASEMSSTATRLPNRFPTLTTSRTFAGGAEAASLALFASSAVLMLGSCV